MRLEPRFVPHRVRCLENEDEQNLPGVQKR